MVSGYERRRSYATGCVRRVADLCLRRGVRPGESEEVVATV